MGRRRLLGGMLRRGRAGLSGCGYALRGPPASTDNDRGQQRLPAPGPRYPILPWAPIHPLAVIAELLRRLAKRLGRPVGSTCQAGNLKDQLPQIRNHTGRKTCQAAEDRGSCGPWPGARRARSCEVSQDMRCRGSNPLSCPALSGLTLGATDESASTPEACRLGHRGFLYRCQERRRMTGGASSGLRWRLLVRQPPFVIMVGFRG